MLRAACRPSRPYIGVGTDMAKHKNLTWKSALPATGLVLLVLLILAVTAWVHTDREPELMQRKVEPRVEQPIEQKNPEEPADRTAPQEPEESDLPSRVNNSLPDRADRDYLRLAGMEDRFTSHLMLSCDWDNTRRHMDGAGWHDNLYLLPAEHDGRDCFRLCWGVYPTREAAEAEGEILPYLAIEFPDRTPKALVEIRP